MKAHAPSDIVWADTMLPIELFGVFHFEYNEKIPTENALAILYRRSYIRGRSKVQRDGNILHKVGHYHAI